MTASITIAATGQNGTAYTFSLAQTGGDTATLQTTQGDNAAESYQLIGIKQTGPTTLLCEVDQMVLFQRPTIEFDCDVTPSPAEYDIAITIAHSLIDDGQTIYPIAESDYTNIIVFLKDANFPTG